MRQYTAKGSITIVDLSDINIIGRVSGMYSDTTTFNEKNKDRTKELGLTILIPYSDFYNTESFKAYTFKESEEDWIGQIISYGDTYVCEENGWKCIINDNNIKSYEVIESEGHIYRAGLEGWIDMGVLPRMYSIQFTEISAKVDNQGVCHGTAKWQLLKDTGSGPLVVKNLVVSQGSHVESMKIKLSSAQNWTEVTPDTETGIFTSPVIWNNEKYSDLGSPSTVMVEFTINGEIRATAFFPFIQDGDSAVNTWIDNLFDSIKVNADNRITESQTITIRGFAKKESKSLSVTSMTIREEGKTSNYSLDGVTINNNGGTLTLLFDVGYSFTNKNFIITLTVDGITYEHNFTLNAISSTVINVVPSITNINTYAYYDSSQNVIAYNVIGTSESEVSISCKYSVRSNGTETIKSIKNIGDYRVEDWYNIYYRLKDKSSGLYSNYNKYTQALNNFNVNNYSAIEFIITSDKDSPITTPTFILDKQEILVFYGTNPVDEYDIEFVNPTLPYVDDNGQIHGSIYWKVFKKVGDSSPIYLIGARDSENNDLYKFSNDSDTIINGRCSIRYNNEYNNNGSEYWTLAGETLEVGEPVIFDLYNYLDGDWETYNNPTSFMIKFEMNGETKVIKYFPITVYGESSSNYWMDIEPSLVKTDTFGNVLETSNKFEVKFFLKDGKGNAVLLTNLEILNNVYLTVEADIVLFNNIFDENSDYDNRRAFESEEAITEVDVDLSDTANSSFNVIGLNNNTLQFFDLVSDNEPTPLNIGFSEGDILKYFKIRWYEKLENGQKGALLAKSEVVPNIQGTDGEDGWNIEYIYQRNDRQPATPSINIGSTFVYGDESFTISGILFKDYTSFDYQSAEEFALNNNISIENIGVLADYDSNDSNYTGFGDLEIESLDGNDSTNPSENSAYLEIIKENNEVKYSGQIIILRRERKQFIKVNKVIDLCPYGWYDNPQGVDMYNRVEYQSSRKYNSITKTWGNFTTPNIRSNWGNQGIDGDGIEYVFVSTKTNLAPKVFDLGEVVPIYRGNSPSNMATSTDLDSKGSDYKKDEYLPLVYSSDPNIKGGDIYFKREEGLVEKGTCFNTGEDDENSNSIYVAECTDDPDDPTLDRPYVWAILRKKTPADIYGKRLWNDYAGKMTLWTNYSIPTSTIELLLSNPSYLINCDALGYVIPNNVEIINSLEVSVNRVGIDLILKSGEKEVGTNQVVIGGNYYTILNVVDSNTATSNSSFYPLNENNNIGITYSNKKITFSFYENVKFDSETPLTLTLGRKYGNNWYYKDFTIYPKFDTTIYQLTPSVNSFNAEIKEDGNYYINDSQIVSLTCNVNKSINGQLITSSYNSTDGIDNKKIFIFYKYITKNATSGEPTWNKYTDLILFNINNIKSVIFLIAKSVDNNTLSNPIGDPVTVNVIYGGTLPVYYTIEVQSNSIIINNNGQVNGRIEWKVKKIEGSNISYLTPTNGKSFVIINGDKNTAGVTNENYYYECSLKSHLQHFGGVAGFELIFTESSDTLASYYSEFKYSPKLPLEETKVYIKSNNPIIPIYLGSYYNVIEYNTDDDGEQGDYTYNNPPNDKHFQPLVGIPITSDEEVYGVSLNGNNVHSITKTINNVKYSIAECSPVRLGVSSEWPYEWEISRTPYDWNLYGAPIYPVYSGEMHLINNYLSDIKRYIKIFPSSISVDSDWRLLSEMSGRPGHKIYIELWEYYNGNDRKITGNDLYDEIQNITIEGTINSLIDESTSEYPKSMLINGIYSSNNGIESYLHDSLDNNYESLELSDNNGLNRLQEGVRFEKLSIQWHDARATMIINAQGPAQQQGKTGRAFIMVGEYENRLYELTDYECPLVYVSLGNQYAQNAEPNKWYFLNEDNNQGIGGTYIAPGDDDHTWLQATNNYLVLISNAIFSDFALFGSAVISGDFILSKSGVITINGTTYQIQDDPYYPPSLYPIAEYRNKPAYQLFGRNDTETIGEGCHDDPQLIGLPAFIPNWFVDLKMGRMYARTSKIGGFIVNPNNIKSNGDQILLNSNGSAKLGKLEIDADGNITAVEGTFNSGTFSNMNAVSGTVGGFTLNDGVLTSSDTNNNLTLNGTNGDITALSGRIGGFTLSGGKLTSSNNNLILDGNGSITAKLGTIGGFVINSTQIHSNDNDLILSSDGTAILNKGTIGGFSIDSNKIYNSSGSIILSNNEESKIGAFTILPNGDVQGNNATFENLILRNVNTTGTNNINGAIIRHHITDINLNKQATNFTNLSPSYTSKDEPSILGDGNKNYPGLKLPDNVGNIIIIGFGEKSELDWIRLNRSTYYVIELPTPDSTNEGKELKLLILLVYKGTSLHTNFANYDERKGVDVLLYSNSGIVDYVNKGEYGKFIEFEGTTGSDPYYSHITMVAHDNKWIIIESIDTIEWTKMFN